MRGNDFTEIDDRAGTRSDDLAFGVCIGFPKSAILLFGSIGYIDGLT